MVRPNKVKNRAGMYHAGNPPPSLQAAQDRLQLVQTTIPQIESQIEFSSPDDFSNDDLQRQWVSRATKALGYWRAERNYLSAWVAKMTSLMASPEGGPAGSGFVPVDGDFSSRIENALAYIRARYTPRYSVTNPPSDESALQKRLRELTHLWSRMETLYSGLRDAAAILRLSEDSLKAQTLPISEIAVKIQEESLYLHSVRRTLKSKEVRFLLEIVDRALANGFVITEEERLKLAEVRSAPVT